MFIGTTLAAFASRFVFRGDMFPLFHLGDAFVGRIVDIGPLFELANCILLFNFDLLSLDNVEREVGVEALLGDEMVLGDEDESGVLFKFKSLSSLSLVAVVLVLLVEIVLDVSGFVLGILKLLVLNVIAPKPNTDCGGVFALIKLSMSCFLAFFTTSLLLLLLLLPLACDLLSTFSCSLPCSPFPVG